MTVPLSIDSSRRAAAMRFGAELSRTMQRVPIGNKPLAAQLGTSGGLIWQWRAGNNLPRLETALRLAAALGNDRLADIVREARSGPCENCGRAFLNEGGSPKRFCSTDCQRLTNVKRSGVRPRLRAVVAERRLALHMAAVDAFCRACEPEGVCRTPECPLRTVSPLRLARQAAPSVLSVVAPTGLTHDAAWLAAIQAANGRRWSPESREAQSDSMRARAASRTPEQRAAIAAAISKGRRKVG